MRTINQDLLNRIDAVRDRADADYPMRATGAFPDQTRGFLRSLADATSCSTTTEAFALAHAADSYREQQRQRFQDDADLMAWYGVSTFELTAEQRIGLLANLPRVKAQHRLNAGNFDATNPDAVESLVLLATGSEVEAQKARTESQLLANEANNV